MPSWQNAEAWPTYTGISFEADLFDADCRHPTEAGAGSDGMLFALLGEAVDEQDGRPRGAGGHVVKLGAVNRGRVVRKPRDARAVGVFSAERVGQEGVAYAGLPGIH